MNTSTLNRTMLAVVIGTVLAAGSVAPAHAQQWRQRHSAREQTAASSQDSEDSREARRKKEREEQGDARQAREQAQAAREGEANRQREQMRQQRDQQQREATYQRERADQREQIQRDREQAALREQQAQIREQNRETRERNAQAQDRERGERFEREQAQSRREQSREQSREQREASREERNDRVQDRNEARQHQRNERQEQRDTRHADLPPPRRLENRQRDQRIVREKQQARTYQQTIQNAIAPQAKSYATTLYNQHRSHGYHYQQQYYWRLLQMLAAWNWNSYNYYNDPYFYTADDYRYYRGGSWYSINRYGADILRQAINYGYQEGFYAGRADHMDGWRYDYRGAWVYRDANYGYRGFYVNQSEYNYYFRQGFRRGYEDGYYQRYRYGRSYNGSEVILGTVLSGILNLQAYRW